MPSTWLGLETSRRGMMVHQRALDTTGHNLANASTEGYSRQEVVIAATDPYSNPMWNSSVTPGQIGTGAMVSMIRRVTDEYLQYNVLQSATDTAYWEEQELLLQRAEACFADLASGGTDEDTAGINSQLVDFYTAWMGLQNSPKDDGLKAAVVEIADSLANLMTSTYDQLDSIQDTIATQGTSTDVASGELKDMVDRANEILTQVKELTKAIEKEYKLGQQPNDLLDQRDALLEELSEIVPIEVVDETGTDGSPTGAFSVFRIFGQDLDLEAVPVGNSYLQLTTTGDISDDITDPAGGEITLQVYNTTTATYYDQNLTTACTTDTRGSLLGLERARQHIIEFKSMLNELATEISDAVNAVDPFTTTGTYDFFTGSLAAGDFSVGADVLADSSLLDGNLAGAVADLRDEEITTFAGVSNPCTFEEYYAMLTTEVGSAVKETDDMAATQSAIREQIATLKSSVSGVSVDEEMTKLLQFNFGFQASSRVINVIDSMLDIIINKLF